MHPGTALLLITLLGAGLLPAAAIASATPGKASRSTDTRAALLEHAPEHCGANPEAKRLAEMILAHPGQQRATLRCNPLLSRIAADKAREMARTGRVAHYGSMVSPNMRLRRAGYVLPGYYPRGVANQVEAVAGGYATAEEALAAFLGSQTHREHLLGEHPFYASQDEIGVGYYRDPDSEHVEYWAVYVAKRRPETVRADASGEQAR